MKFYYSTTNCSNAAGLAFCQRYRFRLHLRQVAYFVWRLLGDKITSGDSWGNFLPFPSSNTKDGYPASRWLSFPTLRVCKIMQIAVFSCSLSFEKYDAFQLNLLWHPTALSPHIHRVQVEKRKNTEKTTCLLTLWLKIRIPKRLQILALIFLSIPTPTPTINFVTISEPQSPSSQQGWFLFQKSQVHTGRNHWPGIKSASLRVT